MMRRAAWAAVALMVLAVGMFLFGYPTRTYLDQRSALGQEQATVYRLAAQNRDLQAEAARLQTPGEVQRLARQDYGLVEPGQEEYAILPAGPTATATPAPTRRATHPDRSPVASAPGSSDGGSVWSRFVHQLEFWN